MQNDANHRQLPSLSLGISNFSKLRRGNKIYVDKTAFVYKLAREEGFYFLSRPRRFGKSLLVSTFESLFKDGLKDFTGLAIEKVWSDTTYPVIHLDFTECRIFSSFGEFKQSFDLMLRKAVYDAGFALPSFDEQAGLTTVPSLFEEFLKRQTKPTVILIDEYDAPLNQTLNNKDLFDLVENELFKFFDILKRRSSDLRFLFITGISKYKNLGIFSGANFVDDLSLYTDFGTLLGYTEDEVKQYFFPYLEKAAHTLNLSPEACLSRMKKFYDGYCLDENAATHVFTPWSTMNFLQKPQRGFQNYWYDSAGTPSVLLNYLKDHSLKDPRAYGHDIVVNLDMLKSYKQVNKPQDEAVLFQTGYLSIKKRLGPKMLMLNYPDEEISDSMSSLYAESITDETQRSKLYTSIINDRPPELIKSLNAVLLAIPYQKYPIDNEYALQAVLAVVIKACGFAVIAEHINALGRSDLEINAVRRYLVLELKFARNDEQASHLLEEAKKQMRKHLYGDQERSDLPHLKIALVFSKEQRIFIAADELHG